MSWAKQPYKIACDVCREVRHRFAAHRRKRLEYTADIGRLVALSTVRNGRQVGAVGLDQQPIGRDNLDGVSKV